MGVYKLSSPKTFKQGGTPFPSMLAGNSTYVPASYEHIETITVSGSSTTSVTFSSLNTYSTTYQHLQIRATLRANDTTGLTYAILNGDTGNNYSWHWLVGNGSSVGSNGGGSFNSWFGYASAKSSEASDYFSTFVMDILDPYETKNKTLRILSGTPGNLAPGVTLHSGAWFNTAAVTSVTVFPNSTNWVAGSRFSIYGIRGA